jgi:hypothetical protein
MRRLAEKVPEEHDVGSWNRCGYVCCSVSETYWKYFGRGRSCEERGAKRKDASAVCCCTFWEYYYSLMWMLPDEGSEICEFGGRRRVILRILKSSQY